MGRKIAGYGATRSPNRELKNVRHSVAPPHQVCSVSCAVTLAIPGVHRSTPTGIEYQLTTVTLYARVPARLNQSVWIAKVKDRIGPNLSPLEQVADISLIWGTTTFHSMGPEHVPQHGLWTRATTLVLNTSHTMGLE